MPTTAIPEITSPPPRLVGDEFLKKFETYGRSTPLVISSVEQICGEEDYDIHKRLVMVTAESVAVGSDDGRVTYYARLSEVDSVIVKNDLLLLRGCPRIGTTVDLLIRSVDSEIILSTLCYYKHHSFRLPLPVLTVDDSVKLQTISWLCDGIDVVDVLLWEIPRREDRLLEVRPQSPKEAKELLVLHQLRRDLQKASELGLRGEPQPPQPAFAQLSDSLRRSPGSVNICAMHSSLVSSFENMEAIFIRVVNQLTKTGKEISSVIAVCREAALLCDFEGNVKRMLRYVQLHEITASVEGDLTVIKLIPNEDEGEQVMTMALVDDERNCHPQPNSLVNAFERAILDAGLEIPVPNFETEEVTLSPPPNAYDEINRTPDFIKKYAPRYPPRLSPEISKDAHLTTFEPSPEKEPHAEEETVVEIIAEGDPLPPPTFRGGIPPFVNGGGGGGGGCETVFQSPRRREILDWLIRSALPYTEAELRTFSAAVIDCGTPEVLKITRYLMETVKTMADKERESNKQEAQKVSILQSKVASLEQMMKEATAKEQDFEATCVGLEMQLTSKLEEITNYEIRSRDLTSKVQQLEEALKTSRENQPEDQSEQIELLNDKLFELRGRVDNDDQLRKQLQTLREENAKLKKQIETRDNEPPAPKPLPTSSVDEDMQSERSLNIAAVSTPRSSSCLSLQSGLESNILSEPTTPRDKPAKSASTPDSLSLCKVSSILARLSERTKSISDGYAKPLSALDELSDSAKVKRRNSVSSISSSSYAISTTVSTKKTSNYGGDSNIPPFAAPASSSGESTASTSTTSKHSRRTVPSVTTTTTNNIHQPLTTSNTDRQPDPVDTSKKSYIPLTGSNTSSLFASKESKVTSTTTTTTTTAPETGTLKSFSDMLEEAKMKARNRMERDPEGTSIVTMQTMLDRARNREREQRAETEVVDGGAPKFSGSPKGVVANWGGDCYEDKDPSLCSALQDYVTTVSVSPERMSDGGVTASPPPPPNHAPIVSSASISHVDSCDKLTQSTSAANSEADTNVDQFSSELLDAGLTNDEQLAVKRLGVRNSRHLEFVTLAELRSSLAPPSVKRLLKYYNLTEPEIPDHFLCAS